MGDWAGGVADNQRESRTVVVEEEVELKLGHFETATYFCVNGAQNFCKKTIRQYILKNTVPFYHQPRAEENAGNDVGEEEEHQSKYE